MPSDLSLPLERLVQGLRERRPGSPSAGCALLGRLPDDPAYLSSWETLDHPPGDAYGRALVHAEPGFEVMVMSWQPGDCSAIHDHGRASWGTVRVYGRAEHAVFAQGEGILSTRSRELLPAGALLPVCGELVHQMRNPGPEPFLSVHVYGGPAETGGVTQGARLFDVSRGTLLETDGGAFFDVAGAVVAAARRPGPGADAATLLRHDVELLRRGRRADPETPLARQAPAAWRRVLAPATVLADAGRGLTGLRRELRALAHFQLELLEADSTAESVFQEANGGSGGRGELRDLLARDDPDRFLRGYLEAFLGPSLSTAE